MPAPQGPLGPAFLPMQPRGVASIMAPAQHIILWPLPSRVVMASQSSGVMSLRSAHSMYSFSRLQHIWGLPLKSPAATTTPLLARNFL